MGKEDFAPVTKKEQANKLVKKPSEKYKLPSIDIYADSYYGLQICLNTPDDCPRSINDIEIEADDLSMSCGALELNGVAKLESLIKDMMQCGYSKEGSIEHVKKAFKKAISSLKVNKAKTFILASNNTETPMTNRILSELCIVETPWKRSASSGNRIKIWTL